MKKNFFPVELNWKSWNSLRVIDCRLDSLKLKLRMSTNLLQWRGIWKTKSRVGDDWGKIEQKCGSVWIPGIVCAGYFRWSFAKVTRILLFLQATDCFYLDNHVYYLLLLFCLSSYLLFPAKLVLALKSDCLGSNPGSAT